MFRTFDMFVVLYHVGLVAVATCKNDKVQNNLDTHKCVILDMENNTFFTFMVVTFGKLFYAPLL